MRKTFLAVALLVGGTAALAAQTGGSGGMGGMGGMRMQPPPNHWNTMDSVGQALSLTDAEKTQIKPQYDSINAILMRAQAIRDSLRSTMQGGGDFRAAMQAARGLLQPLQDQEDALVKAIRGKLTADQAAKLDAAPPPRVLRQRPPGGMGGGPGQ